MGKFNPYFRPSPLTWLLIITLAGLSWATPNPLLTSVSLLALPIFAMLLWVRGEPPILFFVVAFQWVEVTTKVFHADRLGISVEEMFGGEEVRKAIWLGLAGLLAVTFGMRLAMTRLRVFEAVKMQEEVTRFSLRRLFAGYWLALIGSLFLRASAGKFELLKQFFWTLSSFKWVMFFLLAYTVLRRKEKKIYLILPLALEVILGFTGFFSSFKYVFYVLILVLLAVGYRMTARNTIWVTASLGFVLFLSSLWMSFRGEYRSFLNQGTKQQVVAVPLKASLAKLVELMSQIDRSSLEKGFELVLERAAYVDMFAYVLRVVPQALPYEKGALWLKAIEHVFTPRLFFPDKPPLPSDSITTAKYTGMWWAGEETGTSISMGYMVESYIDFGDYRYVFGANRGWGQVWD